MALVRPPQREPDLLFEVMIARGLVARTDEPMDRRTTVLAPTVAGIALAGRAVVAGRVVTEATLEPLALEGRTALLSLLYNI
jgi:hypothetical protein